MSKAPASARCASSRIVNLADDLALALAAAVRIEAPVPGRPYVGIEVPNPDKSLVSLRGIVESRRASKAAPLALPLAATPPAPRGHGPHQGAAHAHLLAPQGRASPSASTPSSPACSAQHGPEPAPSWSTRRWWFRPATNGIPHLYGKVITDVEQVMGVDVAALADGRPLPTFPRPGRATSTPTTRSCASRGGQPLPYIVPSSTSWPT